MTEAKSNYPEEAIGSPLELVQTVSDANVRAGDQGMSWVLGSVCKVPHSLSGSKQEGSPYGSQKGGASENKGEPNPSDWVAPQRALRGLYPLNSECSLRPPRHNGGVHYF